MWKHIRWAMTVAGVVAGGVYWLATTSIAKTIESADGFFYQNLQWIGWESPPDSLASQATNHTIVIVSVVVGAIGALAFSSWIFDTINRRVSRGRSPSDGVQPMNDPVKDAIKAIGPDPMGAPPAPIGGMPGLREGITPMTAFIERQDQIAAVEQVLERLRGRIKYATDAIKDGGDRLAVWREKVRLDSQDVRYGVLGLSLASGSSREALDELNDMPKLADSKFNDEHVANLYLSRAQKAEDRLKILLEILTDEDRNELPAPPIEQRGGLSDVPDTPMWQAIPHVAAALGDDDPQGCYAATLRAIRQAASRGRVTIWGKRELETPSPRGSTSDIWTPIDPSYWVNHKINSTATGQSDEERDHSYGEPLNIHAQDRYFFLRARRREIVQQWPRN